MTPLESSDPSRPRVDRAWLAAVSLAERNRDLERQLAELRHSRSWRLTAPLRALLAWLRPASGAWQPAPLRNAEPGEADDPVEPRWLVDVTDLAGNDFHAGVQRVSRSLLVEWLVAPPPGVRIEPVRLTPEGRYCHARRFLARFSGRPEAELGPDVPVRPRAGDQFLGLDLVRDYPDAFREALGWLRQAGVPISVVVHDLLPLEHPEWFPVHAGRSFRAWLDTVERHADRFLCISNATRESLDRALAGTAAEASPREVFPLGADLPPWPPAPPVARDPDARWVLTLGTLEPRKGHAEILAAMERLWRQGSALHWRVIGRPGWGTQPLLAKLRAHPERGRRLVWIEDGSDDEVNRALDSAELLLNASFGEGYGLPVAEAAARGLPLLLRDIPVFREIAGDHAQYFGGPAPGDLSLEQALARFAAGPAPRPAGKQWPRWCDSAQALARILSRPTPERENVHKSDADR